MNNKFISVLIIFLLLLCAVAWGNEANSGEEIIKKVLKNNKGLNDFFVKFDSKVYFMFMEIPLSGEIYFKSPDRLRLKFNYIPDILKNQKSSFNDIVPGAERYNPDLCRFLKTEIKDDRKLSLIEVKCATQQNLQKTFLWINDETIKPDYLVLVYRKGTIGIENVFGDNQNFILPKSQKVEFKLPEFKGKAIIKYYDYKINKGIDDSVFK